MRAYEFITEGRTGSLAPDVAEALPATYVIPELPNQDPYLQYRFGVAMASAKGAGERSKDGIPPFSKSSAWGENQIVIGYMDPKTGEYIDDALAQMGLHGKKLISTPTSEEAKDIVKTSPLTAFKGFK